MKDSTKIILAIVTALLVWIGSVALVIGQSNPSQVAMPVDEATTPQPGETERTPPQPKATEPELKEPPKPEKTEPEPPQDSVDALFEESLREAFQAESKEDQETLCWWYNDSPDLVLSAFKEGMDVWLDSWDDIFHQVFREECGLLS